MKNDCTQINSYVNIIAVRNARVERPSKKKYHNTNADKSLRFFSSSFSSLLRFVSLVLSVRKTMKSNDLMLMTTIQWITYMDDAETKQVTTLARKLDKTLHRNH